jgi:hypothetical protein
MERNLLKQPLDRIGLPVEASGGAQTDDGKSSRSVKQQSGDRSNKSRHPSEDGTIELPRCSRSFPIMRNLPLLFLILSAVSLFATQRRLDSVTIPVYYHGSDTDAKIENLSVPYAVYSSEPEWKGAALGRPYVPPALEANHQPGDVNLLSLYGIKISADLVVDEAKRTSGPDVIVTLDASKAARPDGYPFSIAEVIEAARQCIPLNIPEAGRRRVNVKVLEPSPAAP